jgi:DNA-binding transcriptional regulator LsrR (DeoR family)
MTFMWCVSSIPCVPRPNSLQIMQIALVARRHYLEGRTKVEIAQELGLSRFKIARLLEQGLEEGIVRIEIDVPAHIDLELSRAVEQQYPVDRALVLRAVAGPDEFRRAYPSPHLPTQAQLARAAADLLGSVLVPDDVLGIAWGRTLDAMVDALPALPPCDVVQIVGGLSAADLSVNAVDLLRRVGQRTGGHVYPLHAPLLVKDRSVASYLRQEPQVAQALDMFGKLTKAVVGIGGWQPPNSSVRQALPEDERKLIEEQGACADICASVFDPDGRAIHPELQERAMAITLAELKAIPQVIAVAGGAEKAPAVRAAALSGCVTTLITDADAASDLLAG